MHAPTHLLVGLLMLTLSSNAFAWDLPWKGSTGPHLNEATNQINKAVAVVNATTGPISRETGDKVAIFYARALDEARLVDVDEMNNHCRGLGNHVRDDLIPALTLLVAGLRNVDNTKLSMGQKLLNDWEDWHDAHLDQIKKGPGQCP